MPDWKRVLLIPAISLLAACDMLTVQTPQPSPTPDLRIFEGDISGLPLAVDEVPLEYLPAGGRSAEQISNVTLIDSANDRTATFEQVRKWGRVDGWMSEYVKTGASAESGNVNLFTEVVLYESQEGAGLALNQEPPSGISLLPVETVGDESRLETRQFDSALLNQTFTSYAVVFRYRNMLGVVYVDGPEDSADSALAITLAKILLRKMEALEFTLPTPTP